MTTTASFTALHAPVAEDSMEMSSPANPAYDDDIDIDFDDNIGGVELTDDERMVEDNEQPRPATATDDMMEDDAPQQQEMHVPEQEMQDDFDAAAYEQADPDDELIDYGEDEYEDMAQTHDQSVFQPPAPEINLEDRELADLDFEQVDEEVVREPEALAPEPQHVSEPEVVVVEETVSDVVPAVQDVGATETTAPVDATSGVTEAPTGENDVPAETEAEEVATANEAGNDIPASGDEQHEQQESHHAAVAPLDEPFPELPAESPEEHTSAPIPAPLDTSLDAGADAPSTPTDTGLHPMVVQYGDWEWPLFKSSRQPEGLLKDDNLASVALADLLNNCRYRLALKVGEDISNDQEFVLRFDSMGLVIIENSPSAFNTSLDEVLEVYKQLHVNDGAQAIPPFWLHLSLQPKFASYLTMLKQAAAGGQGISSFVDVPAEEVPESFGEYYPDGDDDPTLYGNASTAEYNDQQGLGEQDAVAEPELAEGDYHEYDTSYENTEGGQEAQEEYDQYDETEQAEYDDYAEGDDANVPAEDFNNADNGDDANDHDEESEKANNGDDANAGVEDPEIAYNGDEASHHQGEAELSHVDVDGASGGSEQPTTAVPDAAGETAGEGEDSNVESAASSTTLRADQANDPVGEYKDEDLIDWDDSTLTSYPSEQGTDDNDEFSTFLTEVDFEAPKDNDVGNDTHADATADVTVQEETTAGDTIDFSNEDSHESALEAAETGNDGNDGDQQYHQVEDLQDQVHESAGDKQHEGDQAQPDVESQQKLQVHSDASGGVANTAVPDQPAHNDDDYIDFGDDIDFDDDTYEQHEARKASEANNSGSKSPLGKRPLDQTGGVDLDEQPELKKVRSS
ncbi:hypothetical protein Q7P37_010775 [Cladosporium fusiforme]